MVRYTVPRMLRSVTLPFGGLLVALALVTLAPPLARPAPAGDPPAPAPTRPIAQAERSLVGQMLVATEALQSPAFARTVVYMVRHHAYGAFASTRAARSRPAEGSCCIPRSTRRTGPSAWPTTWR